MAIEMASIVLNKIAYRCDKCKKSIMIHTRTDEPSRFHHKCPSCNFSKLLDKIYPIYKEVEDSNVNSNKEDIQNNREYEKRLV